MSNETFPMYSEDETFDPARMDAEEFLRDNPDLEPDEDDYAPPMPGIDEPLEDSVPVMDEMDLRNYNEPPTNFGEV